MLTRMMHFLSKIWILCVIYSNFVFCVDENVTLAVQSFNEGARLESENRIEEAKLLYEEALQFDFKLAEAHLNLGRIYSNNGRLEDALRHSVLSFEYSTSNITRASSLSNMGLFMLQLVPKSAENLNRIIEVFSLALFWEPNLNNAIYNIGKAMSDLGDYEGAYHHYYRLKQLDPNSILASSGLGNLKFWKNDFLGALQHYYDAARQSISSKSQIELVLNNLGQTARRLHQFTLACHAFRTANCKNRNNTWAIANAQATMRYSLDLRSIQDVDEEVIQRIDSDHGLSDTDLKSSLSPYFSLLAPWIPIDVDVRNSKKFCSNLHSIQLNDRQISSRLHVGYLSYDFRQHSMGYLTYGYFIRHSLGIQRHVLLGLNDELLNQSQLMSSNDASMSIVPYAFSYGPSDGSLVASRVQSQAYAFYDFASLSSDYHIAEAIRDIGVDIIIDLMGHTTNSRSDIAGLKPASIIVNYLGYPGTMGCSSHDYVILDKRTMPVESFPYQFTEKAVYLPHAYQVNEYLLDDVESCFSGHNLIVNIDNGSYWSVRSMVPTLSHLIASMDVCRDRIITAIPPPIASSKPTLVLCNFNSNHKLNVHDLDLWSSIVLRLDLLSDVIISLILFDSSSQDGDSRHNSTMTDWLHDQCEAGSSLFECSKDSLIEDRLIIEFMSRGVKIDNIRIAKYDSRKNHMHRLSGCDLFLDSLVYGAHTTASDSLWAEVPIISLWNGYGSSTSNGMFGRMVGRISSSLSFHAWSGSAVTSMNSVKEYEDESFRLSSVPGRLTMMKYKLKQSLLRYPLFNADVSTSVLERSYQTMKDIQIAHIHPMNIVLLPQMSPYSGFDYFRKVCIASAEHLLNQISIGAKNISEMSKVKSILNLMLAASVDDSVALYLTAISNVYEMEHSDADDDDNNFITYLKSSGLVAISSHFYFNDYLFWKNALVVNLKLLKSMENMTSQSFPKEILFNLNLQLPEQQSPLISSIVKGVVDLNFDDCSRSSDVTLLVTAEYLITLLECSINRQTGYINNRDFMGNIGYFEQFSNYKGQSLCELNHVGEFTSSQLIHHRQHHVQALSRLYSTLCLLSSSYQYDSEISHIATVFGHEGIVLTSKLNWELILRLSSTWLNQYLNAMMDLDDSLRENARPQLLLTAKVILPILNHLNDWMAFQQSVSTLSYLGLHEIVYRNVVRHSLRTHALAYQPSSIQANRNQLRSLSGKGKVIAIMCSGLDQSWFPNWGPNTLERSGLGGSEEAVVLLSRALSDIGYLVEVYANPLKEDEGIDQYGVSWYQHYNYDPWMNPPDVLIAWRYQFYLALTPDLKEWSEFIPIGVNISKRREKVKTMYWLHDVFKSHDYHKHVLNLADVILCQSEFHKSQLMDYMLDRTIIFGNGLDDRYFIDGLNVPNQFIYASSPTRGLGNILTQWPTIKRHIPNASLTIYYGFTRSVIEYGRSLIANFDSWMAHIMTLMEQDGVNYIGMVSHVDLSHALSNASLILYPTDYPETSCITLMKGMAMGAIPVSSRYLNSAVHALTLKYDLGPLTPHEKGKNMSDFMINWTESVVKAYEMDNRGELVNYRREMKEYARNHFSWKKAARSLYKVIEK